MLSKAWSAFGKLWVPVLISVVIVGWQIAIAHSPETINPAHGQRSMMGAYHNEHFVYFAYYLGLYPVTSELFIKRFRAAGPEGRMDVPDAYFSEQAAKDIVAHQGHTLIMDFNYAINVGARLKSLLYLPNAIWTGTPKDPSYKPVNASFFVLGLIGLFLCLWQSRHRVLAVVTIVLVGSYPFQLAEVYAKPRSIFGWLITSCLLLLALNGPVWLGRNAPRRAATAAILSAVWLGTMAHVRFEIVVLVSSVLFGYLVHPSFSPRLKLQLAGALIGATLGTQAAWTMYLDHKYDQAIEVVRNAGGHPYEGPRQNVHVFWHSVWCGLGDFDTRYGYEWNDRVAYAYAEPILEEKYHLKVPPRDEYYYLESWDPAGKYLKKPELIDAYNQVIRDKVLHDIANDPGWYLGILAKRTYEVVAGVPPLQVHLGFAALPVQCPAALWLGLGLVAPLVLIYLRRWEQLKLMVFCLPLMAPPLLIYGKGGMAYSIHHLLSVAVLIEVLAEWALGKGRPAAPRPGEPRCCQASTAS